MQMSSHNQQLRWMRIAVLKKRKAGDDEILSGDMFFAPVVACDNNSSSVLINCRSLKVGKGGND